MHHKTEPENTENLLDTFLSFCFSGIDFHNQYHAFYIVGGLFILLGFGYLFFGATMLGLFGGPAAIFLGGALIGGLTKAYCIIGIGAASVYVGNAICVSAYLTIGPAKPKQQDKPVIEETFTSMNQ